MSTSFQYAKFKHVDILQKEASYFLAVAEALNISKAAEQLGIQQSGLSRAILRLEHEFGQKLFQRKNNGLTLTPSGENFHLAIKNTKRNWEAQIIQFFQEADTPTGLIKIGFHSSFGQNIFPRVAQKLTTLFTEIDLEVHTQSSYEITRGVAQGDLDFGFIISEIRNPEVVQKKIGEDYIAGFQRNLKETPTHVLLNPEMQMGLTIIKKYGSLRKIAIKDYEVMAKTALASNYVALLPYSVAKNYPELKQSSGSYKKADISFICHKDQLKSKAYKKIFDEILLAVRS